jgi:hypothetical protein
MNESPLVLMYAKHMYKIWTVAVNVVYKYMYFKLYIVVKKEMFCFFKYLKSLLTY